MHPHLFTIAGWIIVATLASAAVAAWRGKRRGPWIAAGFAAWAAGLIQLLLAAEKFSVAAWIMFGVLCGTFAAGLICVPPGRSETERR
jgi:hypothetical protein